MGCLKQSISMPLPYNHEKHTNRYNVSSRRTQFSICSPRNCFFNITHFHDFLIVDTSQQSPPLSQSNCRIQSPFQTAPQNSNFSEKAIHRRKTCQTYHKNSPPKSSRRRTCTQSLQIPQKLWPALFFRQLMRTHQWPQKQSPNSYINKCVQEHMPPQSAISFPCTTTQRHQLQSHMADATVPQKTFQLCAS